MTVAGLPPSARLTVENYRAQAAVGRATVRDVLRQWKAVDPLAVDRSWSLLAESIAATVEARFAASSLAATDYVKAHAALAGVALVGPHLTPTINVEQVATALRVTGPVAVKVAARAGMNPANAFRAAAVRLSGSAQRLALAGGRGVITSAVEQSPHVTGYRRVGVGKSCDFCSMLISRGGAYRAETTAGRAFHDHDDCQIEPVYHGQDDSPEVAQHLARYLANA